MVEAGKPQSLLLRIHGKVYDATDFKKRHPGGSVIAYYNGSDATDVFDNFHYRSPKAEAMLRSLPQVDEKEGMIAKPTIYDGADDNEAMLQDFRRWRQSLIDRGFFEPDLCHSTYRVAEVAAIFGMGTACFYSGWWAAGVLLWGLFGGRCGWIQHECLHGSFVRDRQLGKVLGKFFIGFGLSTSGDKWQVMHDRHHAATQKEGHDMDLDTTPLVAFYKRAVENGRARRFSRSWLRCQAYTFVPITSGMFVMLFWIMYLHPANVLKKRLYGELLCMALSHVVKTAIIADATGCGLLASYALFWAVNWVAGCYLFSQFSLSHTFLPTVQEDDFPTWVDYALRHTVDQSTQSPTVNWIQGYLNCQVIHHLFTKCPQFRQPQISLELEKFAQKWNRPYQHITYMEAWRRMFSNLDVVGRHYYQDTGRLAKED